MQDDRQSREEFPNPGTPTEQEKRLTFPKNAVVGVIDSPDELRRALDDLYAAGFDESSVHVLSGERGIELIDPTGSNSGLSARLTRMTQAVFGIEAEHTRRHVEEVDAGHYLVLVPSTDDETTDRIRDVLVAHGGHFINYYTTWTSRLLAS